jgi:hypothetical protein
MTQEIVSSAVTPPRSTAIPKPPPPSNGITDSPSKQFPYIITDTNDEIFGLMARLMDPKRTDAIASFAVTYAGDSRWNLWLNEPNRDFLIRMD